MKTYIFALAMAVVFLTSFGQTSAQHNSALKFNTFRVPDALFTMAIEHAFSNHFSAELSIQGGRYMFSQPTRVEKYRVLGKGVIGAMRYYPFTKKRTAPNGFFAFGAIRYVDFKESYTSTVLGHFEVGAKLVNIGGGAGYKYSYRRIGAEAFIGWGAGTLKSDDTNYRQSIPEFFQAAIEEQKHFPMLDVAICYMMSWRRKA